MIYRFGHYSLDTDLLELRGPDGPVAIEPQVFDLLHYLVRNRDRVVSKREILDTLWADRFVSESALSSRMKSARKAVGDTGSDQRTIRTLHGRGFRFVAPVEESGDAGPAGSPAAPRLEQEIRYCTTEDGVPLAWSSVGSGPVLIRVLGWFTHLQAEWDWPEFRRLWERLGERFTVVRYDGRGIGLSSRSSDIEYTEESRQLDLQAVVDATGASQVALFGISEGGWTAAQFAVNHPGRVSHLVLYGSYARGALARPGYDAEEDRAMTTLMRKGWGRGTPQFRNLFTLNFFAPDVDPETLAHFDELQRLSADAETAARYQESSHRRGDGRAMFAEVRTPTLVIHQRGDRAVHFEEGQILAATIPDARFLPLPGSGHYFPMAQSTSDAVVRALEEFVRP